MSHSSHEPKRSQQRYRQPQERPQRALEWQSIIAAATIFRQPIWAASFTLQAMNPIPQDYASDQYWP